MIKNTTHVMLFYKGYNEALDFYMNKLHSKTNSYRFEDKKLFWDDLIFKLILFRQQAYSQKYMSRAGIPRKYRVSIYPVYPEMISRN
jgi:hypothetical protein